jgi:hypothetical protein
MGILLMVLQLPLDQSSQGTPHSYESYKGENLDYSALTESAQCSSNNGSNEGFKLLSLCGDDQGLAMTLWSAYSHYTHGG